MRISVQISTFNRASILKQVLLSLDNQTIDKNLYEVLVINDGSTDDTKEMVEHLLTKVSYRLRLINQENLGLPIARNKGIINTQYEVILFIDDDVLADKNLILEHYKIHEQKDKVVVRGWVNHINELKIPEKPVFKIADFSTSFFWTSNVSIRREYLIKAGMFYEKFDKYGWEDIEIGYKLRKLGLKLLINNRAIGYHYKPLPSVINLERVLEIEKKRAISAKIYYNLYQSLRAKLATGNYFPSKNFYQFLSNSFIYDFVFKCVESSKNGFLSKIFLSLLKKMHYYKHL